MHSYECLLVEMLILINRLFHHLTSTSLYFCYDGCVRVCLYLISFSLVLLLFYVYV